MNASPGRSASSAPRRTGVCHCRTMPRLPLLISATLIGTPSIAQVANSWLVIWKQPSPSIAHTSASGRAELGAHGRRDGEAHGAQPAGVQPGARLLVLDELRGPHLVLANAGDVDGVRTGDLAELLDHVFRPQAAVALRAVAQRVGACGRRPNRPTRRSCRSCRGVSYVAQHRDEVGDDGFDIADDRHVGDAGSCRSRPGRYRRG